MEIAVVESGDDEGTSGAKGVRAFRAPPLAITRLPGAFADVVTAGDAEDAVRGFPDAHVASRAAHDHHQFTFEVRGSGAFGNFNGVFGVLQAGDGLIENLGVGGHRPCAQMALVIEAHGEDLGRYVRG